MSESSSSNISGIITILVILIVLGLAFYFFIYRKLNNNSGNVSDSNSNVVSGRMTAAEVQKIIDDYSIKDANNVPTLHYNGGFENPDLSKYPQVDLQRMLQNGWWFALIPDNGANSLNGYRIGTNGLYVLSFLDRRNVGSSINSGKSGITIPVQFAPYL